MFITKNKPLFFLGLLAALCSGTGMTAGKTGPDDAAARMQKPKKVLIVGGGGSHDFDRWYRQEDAGTLLAAGEFTVRYTDRTDSIASYLKDTDVLVLCNNQPIGEQGRRAITRFVKKGNGLVLLHAALWYNWPDWPAYNRDYAGGGSESHEKYQEFRNYVVNSAHPVTRGVPRRFDLQDELYRYAPDPDAKGIDVLAVGQSKETAEVYPVVFTIRHPGSRIAGITLGHDENSHQRDEYKTLLVNAVRWVSE